VGSGGVISVTNTIAESNTNFGMVVNGTLLNLKFDTCYFEQNTPCDATDYQVSITNATYTSLNDSVHFLNCYFASTGLSKAATIVTGRAFFQNCTHVGDTSATAVTVAGGATCRLDNSFAEYANTGIEIIYAVQGTPATGNVIKWNAGGYAYWVAP